MILVMAAALLGALAYGGLGWWADDYSLIPLVLALFGGALGSALVAISLFLRDPG
jgi:hypothetical protein